MWLSVFGRDTVYDKPVPGHCVATPLKYACSEKLASAYYSCNPVGFFLPLHKHCRCSKHLSWPYCTYNRLLVLGHFQRGDENGSKTSFCVCADKKHAPTARHKMTAAPVLTQTWSKYVSRMRVRASVWPACTPLSYFNSGQAHVLTTSSHTNELFLSLSSP
jgi:hypothetical protein